MPFFVINGDYFSTGLLIHSHTGSGDCKGDGYLIADGCLLVIRLPGYLNSVSVDRALLCGFSACVNANLTFFLLVYESLNGTCNRFVTGYW